MKKIDRITEGQASVLTHGGRLAQIASELGKLDDQLTLENIKCMGQRKIESILVRRMELLEEQDEITYITKGDNNGGPGRRFVC